MITRHVLRLVEAVAVAIVATLVVERLRQTRILDAGSDFGDDADPLQLAASGDEDYDA